MAARAEMLLAPILLRQDDVVTTAQALAAGVTERQLRSLLDRGWTQPARGVFIKARPADAFRSSVRAALLVCPDAAACRTTAARLHELWGLPLWKPSEVPQLLVPRGARRLQRRGMRLFFGLEPGTAVMRGDIRLTGLARTVSDMSTELTRDDLVCLLDSAMRCGWSLRDYPLSRTRAARVCAALVLADARSESPLETKLRLLLVREGLAPEALQHRVFDHNGRCYARLDLAWPSRRLAVEADGREDHDKVEALYRDRQRQNDLTIAGWTVLRFTWFDVTRRPGWVVAQVRAALALSA